MCIRDRVDRGLNVSNFDRNGHESPLQGAEFAEGFLRGERERFYGEREMGTGDFKEGALLGQWRWKEEACGKRKRRKEGRNKLNRDLIKEILF